MDRVGILVGTKGRGSNMARLIESMQSGEVPAVPHVVVSTGAESPALEVARGYGVRTLAVTPKPEESFADRLEAALEGCDWVCLAGFMRKVPIELVQKYKERMLNIHPALLPKFGGKGMYGMHVHEAVIAAGESESGCTVHWVTEEYDEGAIILQNSCPISRTETPETLAQKVLELEWKTYPAALAKVIRER